MLASDNRLAYLLGGGRRLMVMVKFDITSQAYFRNPPAEIARLRAMGPVVEIRFPIIGRVWIATTQELAGRILKECRTFTLRRNGAIAGVRWWMPRIIHAVANNMLTMDEPDHTRLREIVDEAFCRRAILAMELRIGAIADGIAAELFDDRYARRVLLAVRAWSDGGLPKQSATCNLSQAQARTRLGGTSP